MSARADVVVVGSGPAGVSAAWPLVEAGLRVLMLDAADAALPALPAHADLGAWRADPERWRHELGRAGPLADSDVSPKFATPLARAVLAGFAGAAGLDAQGYMAVGSLAAGGLSNVWGALATRYAPADLARLPDPAALEESYARVAVRIGLGGGRPVAEAPAGSLTAPVAHIAARHARVRARTAGGLHLETAPNAVLVGMEREGRGACTACGLCLHGCARGSIYSSAQELPALRRRPNFTYRSGVRVERLAGGPGMHVVHARAGGEAVSFRAPAVVLAAGTLMTSGLALRRLGLAGRPVRLLGNPVGGMAFVVPRLIGAALPARSFALGQLLYALEAAPGVEAAGVLYGADTLPLSAIADRLPFTRPYALRLARALAPALVIATGYLPGDHSRNRLIAEEDGAAGRLRIEGGAGAPADGLLRAGFARLRGHLRRRGGWGVPGSLGLLPPGADAHPAGTLPMGGQGPAATDAGGELAGLPGLFVADGAALPHLAARHPTLTIMANADRIGRALARRILAAPALRDAG